MKKFIFIIAVFLYAVISHAQVPEVVVFRHELRWTDEVKFPDYFLLPDVLDSVYSNTRQQLMNYLEVTDIKFPDEVQYDIIPGFGKQKTDMPANRSGSEPEIGIFSIITRATTGYAIFWQLKIRIIKANKVILDKEVRHELEYFDASGYVESRQWISPQEFRSIFHRLVSETLGTIPASNEKIILGSPDPIEARIRSMAPYLKRTFLKLKGGWKTSGNFAGLIESGNDTLLKFNFKEKSLESVRPSAAPFFASLFTDITGIDMEYDQDISRELNGIVTFSDGQEFGIKLKWFGTETRSVQEGTLDINISNPGSAELYEDKVQTGYFSYASMEKVRSTEKTTEKFNVFTGNQIVNSLGIERIDRIKGSLSGKEISGEFNENNGIIMINSGDTLLGAMVVINCNPESRSVSGNKISKNKVFMLNSSGMNPTSPSMENSKKVEWYPFYISGDSSYGSGILCIKTLICLFFGIGNMSSQAPHTSN
jgi:hypothetical protein